MRGRLAITGARTEQPCRGLVRALGVAIATAIALGPWRVALAAPKSFAIATTDAPRALAEFGRQSGREILFEYDLIAGQQTHPIAGNYEPVEALRRMTAGTQLRVTESADGVLVIECSCAKAARAAAPKGGPPSSMTSAAPLPADSAPGRSGRSGGQTGRAGSAGDAVDIQEVLVTGSRIPQDASSAPMPLTAIDRTYIADTGSDNIAEAIVQLPSVNVGQGLSNTQQLVVGAGLSLVSLRGLGTARTLVLVDGRRQVSGSPLSAAVDLNTIPAELVERVEVVTGGTSAIYGADAIGGVINLILKKHFEGVSVRAEGGISSRGDAASHGLSVTAGKTFEIGGRPGNAELSFVYDSADGVLAGARPYASNGLALISNPAYQGPNGAAPAFITRPDANVDAVSTPGDFTIGGQTFIFSNDGGSIRPFDFGPLGDRSGVAIGGDAVNPEPTQSLLEPIEREVFGGTLHQALSDSMELFLETRIARTSVQSSFEPTFDVGDVSLGIDNAFLPAAAVALMQANGAESIALHRIIGEWGVRGTDNDRLMQQYVAGIEGTLPNQWVYDVSYSYGHTSESTMDTNDRNNARFIQSLDAVRDPLTGQIVCQDPSNGCVPLDLVGIGQASAAAIDFSRVDSLFRRWASQQVADADLTGELPGLPAGRLQFAAGLEYRRESAASVPSAAEQAGELFLPQIATTGGGFDVREGYLELHVPLVRNTLLLHRLAFNAAFRLSDYDTSGRQSAWDGGLEYEPVQGLRLRGVYSRSVRAPNIGELYSPHSVTFFFGQDPCDASVNRISSTRFNNCAALGIPPGFEAPTNQQTLEAVVGGNPGLEPEIGDTWSAGFVWQPAFLAGVSVAADYWNIAIRHAISTVPPQAIVNDCVDSAADVTANPDCALVARDPITHAILAITATDQNIASLQTAGVDMHLGWSHDVRPPLSLPAGEIRVSAVATWLRSLDLLGDATDPETLVIEGGVVGNPRWRALAELSYRTGGLRIGWHTQFMGDSRIAWFPGIPANEYDLPMTGTRLFHDLAIEYRLGRTTLHLNVDNVFDQTPPARGFEIHSGLGTGAAIYPNLGRLFSASAAYRF
ncbi:MAG TPA: TonB-dependent receptor [Steroidobacteraceae bacterium]|nr:TonB-dependent receptor [Steroidobacteraceae bacterium]